MALFEWKESYSVNITGVDIQHKRLVEILNELYEAMSARKAKEIIDGILNKMSNYAAIHFLYEEELMKKHNYPEFNEHKKLHDAFVAKVSEFIQKHKEGHLMLSLDVMNFLKDWLKNHIQGVDKKYGPFFNQRGIN
jgi:hemerythrin